VRPAVENYVGWLCCTQRTLSARGPSPRPGGASVASNTPVTVEHRGDPAGLGERRRRIAPGSRPGTCRACNQARLKLSEYTDWTTALKRTTPADPVRTIRVRMGCQAPKASRDRTTRRRANCCPGKTEANLRTCCGGARFRAGRNRLAARKCVPATSGESSIAGGPGMTAGHKVLASLSAQQRGSGTGGRAAEAPGLQSRTPRTTRHPSKRGETARDLHPESFEAEDSAPDLPHTTSHSWSKRPVCPRH